MTIDTIVMDVDDTLLNSQSVLTEHTVSVLKECLRRGIRVIPASGRTRAAIRPVIDRLDTRLPYICGNGTELIGADHGYLERTMINAETLREICLFLEQENVYFHFYQDDVFYFGRECRESRDYAAIMTGLRGVAVGKMSDFVSFPVPKMLAIADPAEIAALIPRFRERFDKKVFATSSKAEYMEVIPLGASKGAALARLTEIMGLDPEKMLVFGDSLNDIPMITFGPNGVAMGNAREEVKAAARFVCGSCDEDGLARFVEEHVLKGVVG